MEYLTPIDLRYYCPIPDCGVFVPADKADQVFRRAKCPKGHLTCVDCRQPAHTDAVQCVQNRDMELVQKLANEEGWRRCYRCHTMVEHSNACRHMTCRCGAEFCYVCGKIWWTCGCTERQLDQIKKRARQNAARRRAQEERERREIEELKKALEAIAKMEAADAEKLERICAAKEVQRKKHVQRTYAELRTKVDEINEFQRGFLDGQHVRDRDRLELRIDVAMDGLRLKHDARLSYLHTSLKTKIEEREKELEQDWQERVANEKKAEADYKAQLDEWAKTVKNGDRRKEELLKAQKSKHDQGRDGYMRKRDDELDRLRWVLDEEVTIERELMDAKTARVEESFKVQQRELQVKVRTELRWLELVFPERGRLLDRFLAVELADEIVDDADDRWNTFIVKEEAGEAGPSRFRSAMKHAKG